MAQSASPASCVLPAVSTSPFSSPDVHNNAQAVDSEADARQASGTNKLSTAADQINAPKDPTGGRSDAGRRSDK